MTAAVESFLALIENEPTLLYPAREGTTPAEMDRRARADGQKHPCLRCAKRASCAYVIDTTLGPRWLDLCFSCASWVRRGSDGWDD